LNKNLYFNTIVSLLIFLCACSLSQAEQLERNVQTKLNEIYKVIRTIEKKVLNVKVDSECWKEKWDPKKNEWIKDSEVYISCTSWFNGLPKSKARIDVHKEVLKWTDGVAPYAEDEYSVSFDGQLARKVHHRSGPINKTFKMREAYITSQPSKDLYAPWYNVATGARFSLVLHNNNSGVLMSEYFKMPDQEVKAPKIELKHEKFSGVECVKFGSGYLPRIGEQAYWFDPGRGYALMGTKRINIRKDGTEWLVESMKVEELKEVSEGIWWPTKATLEGEDPSTGELTRSVYRASNIVINDPDFN